MTKHLQRCVTALAKAWIVAAVLLGPGADAHANTPLPYYDDFAYANGTNLDGTNGWEIFTTGPGSGDLPDRYHGWLGQPGGTATALNETGRVAGVSLLNTFGAYSGEPGLG